MMTDEEQTWERLKYGCDFKGSATVEFEGNGTATKYHSAWLGEARYVYVTVDDVAQSAFRDFKQDHLTIIFTKPPAKGAIIHVKAYG